MLEYDQRKARLAIVKALAKPNRSYFSRAQRLRDDQRIGDDVEFAVLPSVITLDKAIKEFVFISEGRWIVSRTAKTVRKYDDALKEYAASTHLVKTDKFDATGQPKMKAMAVLKLWLDSPNRLTADVISWEPGAPEFCHAPERMQGGDHAYNLWVPPSLITPPPNWQEWVNPFLSHVKYLVPIETERYRFLCWLAHIFQHPDILPHTAYLMVATETGIGRGTLASILTRALRGYVAVNINVDSLFGGFNGRCSQKLLATVDEIREGHSRDRYKNAEALKSKITEDIREVNRKYGLQTVEKNCCRWLMFSNHMDALPFDNNDRRLIVIENPSERRPPEWYGNLHGLMDNPMFIASVQHYLMTLDLMGYNPHEPASINEAKRKALAALESPAGRKCREFAELWPDELAARLDLVTFIGLDAPPGRALDHDIQRAGMRTAHGQKVGGSGATVLIVRGALTPEDLLSVPKPEIAKRILAARAAFALTDAG